MCCSVELIPRWIQRFLSERRKWHRLCGTRWRFAAERSHRAAYVAWARRPHPPARQPLSPMQFRRAHAAPARTSAALIQVTWLPLMALAWGDRFSISLKFTSYCMLPGVNTGRRQSMAKTELRPSVYDAIIIGTGQAGPALARRLATAGMTVAVVERALFGGTCVNTGCIPTKTLIASAYAIHMARRAADFGVVIDGPVRADMAAVKARKDAISGQSRAGVEEGLKSLVNCTIYRGHARFVGPREVQVGEALLTAERIFINVGGRAVVPSWPGLDQVAYLTNTSMMTVDFLPRHLVVVGGSYVGLEFAQMYRRFGSEVTVVEMAPRLVHREDPDVSTEVSQILENEGINLRVNAECIRLTRSGDDVLVGVDCQDGPPEINGSHLLLRWGGNRTPTTSASTGRASRRTSAATFSSTTSCA